MARNTALKRAAMIVRRVPPFWELGVYPFEQVRFGLPTEGRFLRGRFPPNDHQRVAEWQRRTVERPVLEV